MIGLRTPICTAALGSCLALLLGMSQRSEATGPGPGHAAAPGCPCIPNAANYGWFPTSWRQWPGQARPEITFPRSIGKELLPTPPGKKQEPLPAATEAPGAPGKPGGSITIPFQLGPGGGLMLPGSQPKLEGLIPGLPSQPEQPAEPGQPPSTPLPGGGLPGLPSEPESAPSPGIATPPEGATPPGSMAPPDSMAPPKDAKPLDPAPSPEPPASRGAATSTSLKVEPSSTRSAEQKPDSHSALVGLLTPADDAQPPAVRIRETVSVVPEPETIVEVGFSQSTEADPSGAADIRVSEPEAKKLQSLTVPPDRTSPVKSALYVGAGLPPGDECLLAEAVEQTSCDATRDRQAAATPADKRTQKQPGRAIDKPADKHPAQPRQPNVVQTGWRPNSPSVALGGYCPVTLSQSDRWVKGNPRFSAVHQGRAYLFADAAQRERFLADPQRYVPACSGYDPVLLADENLHVTGQLDYSIAYAGRLYLFSSEATLGRFRQAPQRYVAAIR